MGTEPTSHESPTSVKVHFDMTGAADDNHLHLPQPLWPMRLPANGNTETSAVLVRSVPERVAVGKRKKSFFTWMRQLWRRRKARHVHSSSSAAGTVPVQLSHGHDAAAPSAASKLSSSEPGISPKLKGTLRSPFVDGLRSATREGPGRLVRSLTRGSSRCNSASRSAAPVHFSLHA